MLPHSGILRLRTLLAGSWFGGIGAMMVEKSLKISLFIDNRCYFALSEELLGHSVESLRFPKVVLTR